MSLSPTKQRASLEIAQWALFALLASAFVELIANITLPFAGYDSYCQIFWIGQWHSMWNARILYPRWMPGSFAGFGAPSFYFYPPLSFFLSSGIYAILPNLSAAAVGKALGLLAFAGSGFASWGYLRWRRSLLTVASPGTSELHPARNPEIWAALLYMFAPYHFFDYAVRGALSEHLALVFVPFVFWGLDLAMERRHARDVRRGGALLTLALALLVLSNLPAAAVTGLGAGAYVLAQRKSKLRVLAILAGGAGAAVLLTAFYLLPIGALFNDVQFDRLWQPASVVLSSPFLAVFSGRDLMINSYAMLSLIGACILLAGYWQRQSGGEYPVPYRSAMAWLLLAIVFVQLPFVSQFLFNHIFPFTIIQLASRTSIVLLVVASLAWMEERNTVGEAMKLSRHWRPASAMVVVWSIGTIALVGLQLANVHVHRHDVLPVGEAPEYAPRWSRPYYDFGTALRAPFPTDTTWAVWQGSASTFLHDHREPYSDTIEYDAGSPGRILLRRSYWPSWHATFDGNPTATAPDSLGRVTLFAPAGHHRLITSLAPEPSATMGAWISVGTVVIVGILWVLL